MGKQFDQLSDNHAGFIAAQHMFFVGTAVPAGNETAGHLALINRMTLMWCGFETPDDPARLWHGPDQRH